MGYLLFILLTLVFSFVSIWNDIRKHFLFAYCLVLYFVYIFLGPLNGYLTNNYSKFGGDFYDYFEEGLFIYILGLLSFTGSYLILFKISRFNIRAVKSQYVLRKGSYGYLLILFVIVSYIVSRGAGDLDKQDQAVGLFNYLLFFADSLIIALTILYYENKKNKIFWIVLVVTIVYYLFLGFRYRIILMLIGFIYYLLFKNKLSIKSIAQWVCYLVIFFIFMNFISVNRHVFRQRDIQEIQLSSDAPNEMTPYQFVMQQTSNYSTDFNVLKYIKENSISPDFGETMFYNVYVRITPASFYNNNIKPVAPQQEIIRNSFGSVEGFYAGAAITNIFEYYIAFGVFGVILFMSMLGTFLAYLTKTLDVNHTRNRVFIVIIAMILFQEITRAFMAQIVTLAVYLFFAFYLFYRKRRLHKKVKLVSKY